MREVSAVLLLYLAVFQQAGRSWGARTVALGLAAVAARLCGQAYAAPEAALVALAALMVMASAVPLLGPVAPRLMWALAALGASAVTAFTLIGAVT
jgi:hypothetical protein